MAQLYAVPWAARSVIGVGDVQLFRARLFRSTDGGAHWASATTTWLHAPDVALVAITGVPRTRTLLLGAFGLDAAGDGIYRSGDDGATWTHQRTELPASVRVWALLTAADGATAYAATPQGVYRSADDGRTWQLVGG